MDSVALFLSRDYTLSIIQSLRESKEKCQKDGRRIMAKNYEEIERIMWDQYKVSQSIRENMDQNGGDYVL